MCVLPIPRLPRKHLERVDFVWASSTRLVVQYDDNACLVCRFHSSFVGVLSSSFLIVGRSYRSSVSDTLLKKPAYEIH